VPQSGREPPLQVQSPEFNLQSHQKKRQNKLRLCKLITITCVVRNVRYSANGKKLNVHGLEHFHIVTTHFFYFAKFGKTEILKYF
jgi:hypothetical protein